ncbi:MAG: Ig-like domain-containing protein [Candidatus Nanoarchaeia archaeon]
MEKRLLAIIFLLISIASVSAMTVTLGGPTGMQTSSTINFGCSVIATDENLASLTLWHSIDGIFQANQTNSTAVTEGSEYIFTINNVPNGGYEWNCMASNSTNNVFASSNNTFLVNVAPNRAPVFTEIPQQIWPRNEQKSITLSNYFTDPDGDSLTYSASTSTGVSISISGATATMTPQSWYGTGTVTFTANDGKGGENSTTVSIIVTFVNMPPYNKTEYLNNVTMKLNETKVIDLDDYFGDYDGDTLTYTFRFTTSDTHHINITIDNSTAEARVEPEKDWTGTDKAIFTAYDGQGGSLDSNEVMINVSGQTETGKHAPVITSRSPQINPLKNVGDVVEFSIQAKDDDNDTLTIRWYVDDEEQKESRNKNGYTFLALSQGVYIIRAIVSDGELSDSENWTVNVQPIAGPTQPEIPETPPQPRQLCGNGMVEKGETCSTCPQDVVCPPEYVCQDGKCTRIVKKSNLMLTIIVIGGFLVFAAATLLIYKYYKSKTLFGGWKPKYTGDATNVKLAIKQPEAKEVAKEETTPKWDATKKSVNEVLLKHYVERSLTKGETPAAIKEKLKKVGWSDDKINEAFKAAEQDKTLKK